MLAAQHIDDVPQLPSTQHDEAEAVRLALEGRWLPRARLALTALHRLRQNPDDTRQVFTLSIAVSAPHLPVLLARFLSNDTGLELLTRRAAIDSQSVDYAALRALPADTLGGAYARFMADNNLDPDLFQAPPGLPPAVAYVMQRMRQTHDIWHVVTSNQTDIPGELSVLAFSWGQTGAPSMRLLATLGALRYAFQHPSIFKRVWQAYHLGKRAEFLGNVAWENMWELPLSEVRARLGITGARGAAATARVSLPLP